MVRSLSLYETATNKGRVIRQGDIVQVVMDGAGAFVCAAQDFMVAQKWAMARTGSGNVTTDRGRLLDKVEVLISRPNSFVSTRGSSVPIERLAKAMKQAGYDLKEWNIARDVIELIETRPDQNAQTKKAAPEEPPMPSTEESVPPKL
ncbi:MAG: hypothetical protein V4650_07045 [Pseudomonadota bacterium]